MIDRHHYFCFIATIFMISVSTVNADEACQCPVTDEKVVVSEAEVIIKYKQATVYLCCNECEVKFNADRNKYSTKANLQLVRTAQAKQINCPFGGGPIDTAQSIVVQNVKVSFCCADCKDKAAAAKGDEQLAMLFDDKAFAKGFEVITDSE